MRRSEFDLRSLLDERKFVLTSAKPNVSCAWERATTAGFTRR